MFRSHLLALACAAVPALATSTAAAAEPTADVAAKVEAPRDFTLAVVTGLADVSLLFGFRVNDHIGWSFNLGASFIDKVGLSAGTDVSYFVNEDFQGFFMGFGGESLALEASAGKGTAAFGNHARVGLNFGYKAVFDGGFTLLVQTGPTIRYDETTEDVNGAKEIVSTLRPTVEGRIGLGWTF